MALARRLPRTPHHHAAAGDRQHPPARRADAVGRDVARPRPRGAGHRSPRSTAICAGNSWRRCRSGRRRSISSTFRPPMPTASAPSSSRVAPQSTVEDVPMLRGRIVAARGVKADDLKPSQDTEWVLQSDRGLTYTGEVPKGSKVVEGEWWSADYSGPPLVSLEKKIADGLEAQDRRRDRRQRARPRHPGHDRQSAQRRLAEPRHQFRAGVLAQRLQGRAAHPYRDPVRSPPGRRPATPGSSSRWPTPSRW